MERNFKELLSEIKAFVFDVDGVFTNGQVFINTSGDILRNYSVKDGLAVVRARSKGYPIAIISGGRGDQLRKRMTDLGIEHIYLGQETKLEALEEFSLISGVGMDHIVYMGDDYPDIAPMLSVRLGVAPKDAAESVKEVAAYTSQFKGGEGCVRDIIEQVLRVHGDWFE